jgi:hypothetical protein
MNRAEVARLLALAAAYDRRTVGDADIAAWAAALADIPASDAENAVLRHFRESDAFLMPVHVRRLVKADREAAAERRAHEQLRAELAAIDAAPASLRGRWQLPGAHDDDDRDERRRVRAVPCPYCQALPGKPCTIPGSANATSRPTVLQFVGHPSRIERANAET